MQNIRAVLALSLIALMLAACGKAGDTAGPGGVTVSEARALDDAAEMLKQRRPADALPPGAPAPVSVASVAP